MPWPHILARQFHVTGDNGQGIVEVVRHAPGQNAQRFHLLRLAQPRFDLPALGDIFLHGDVMIDLAAVVLDCRNRDKVPEQRAALAPIAQLSAPFASF